MWAIKLIVETDDNSDVERISEAVALATCPVPFEQMTAEHECEIPWMMITSELDDEEVAVWRDNLNR